MRMPRDSISTWRSECRNPRAVRSATKSTPFMNSITCWYGTGRSAMRRETMAAVPSITGTTTCTTSAPSDRAALKQAAT